VGGISESGWKNQALFTFDRLEATIFGKVDIWVFDFKRKLQEQVSHLARSGV
jgi:hypothetical protein